MTFEALGLREEVLQAILPLGFEKPTPIQEKAIPSLIESHRDLVGLAQTGTGKTAAFGLPMAHLINFSNPVVQGLVLCPTRELCLQIADDLKKYTQELPGARLTAVYGGSSIDKQIKDIRKGAHIIIATPGRLIDLIKRGKVDLNQVDIAVLDEADEMLNMGFKEDIDFILSHTPPTKRTWLFSATMPKGVAAIAKNFMEDPLEITVGNKNSSASTITHKYISINGRNRYLALKRLLDFYPSIYGIVFCNTRHHTREVAEKLSRDGYSAEALHGDLSQAERDSVMVKFRDKSVQILVATDVAARGIDVDEITHVIHYMLPDDVENYTHRSGRTGRAGREGESIVILDSRDVNRLRDVERIMKKEIALFNIPSGEDIVQKQIESYVSELKEAPYDFEAIDPYITQIYQELEGLEKEELITKIISKEFGRLFKYYQNVHDLNVTPRKPGGKFADKTARSNGQYQRIFVNVGHMDGVDKGALLRLVCSAANIPGSSVGRIDLKQQFSFVDVEKQHASMVVDQVTGAELDGRTVRAELSDDPAGGGGGRSGGGGRGRSGGGPKGGKRKGGPSGGRSSGGSRRRSGGASEGGGNRKPYEVYHKRTQHK